ncbi:MAG: radical SAM protein [Clostridiales bacterium]|nr:radical SAM protein [Clostridiales bacterium]
MNLKLYTLPGNSLDLPHLAVPQLVGYLKKYYSNVQQKDFNLDVIDYMLRKEYLEKVFIDLKNDTRIDKDQLIAYEDIVVNHLDWAKNYINNELVYDRKEYILASKVIQIALKVISFKYNYYWDFKQIRPKFFADTIESNINISKSNVNNIFKDIFENEIVDIIDNEIDIVTVSITYEWQFIHALYFARMLKEKSEKVKIIIGGSFISHFSFELRKLINEKCIDAVVLYQGEEVIKFLIEYWTEKDKSKLDTIKIEYEIDDRFIVYSNSHEAMREIPDFSELDLKKYLSNKTILPILSSSNCSYGKCCFCSHFHSYGNAKNHFNLARIMETMKIYKSEYEVDVIYFVDECIDFDHIISISEMMINNRFDILWMVETRADVKYNDKSAINILLESGCCFISFGLETTSDRVLNDMNKGFASKDAIECINSFKDSKILVATTLMIGFPTETIEESSNTLNSIFSELEIDYFGVSIYALLKHSIMDFNREKYFEEVESTDELILSYRFKVLDKAYDRNEFKKLLDKFKIKTSIKRHFLLIDNIIGRTHLTLFKDEQASFKKSRCYS